MQQDINYKASATGSTIALTTDQDTPEILKRAITLMLFSKDESIRNFNGLSVVNAFPTITQAGFPAVNFYLTLAGKRIQEILSDTYDNIEAVYFEAAEDNEQLIVTLNIKLTDADAAIAQTVYTL